MAETGNLMEGITPEFQELLDIVTEMDTHALSEVVQSLRSQSLAQSGTQALIDAVAGMSCEDRAALARAVNELEVSRSVAPKDRIREHVWESVPLAPDGEDLFLTFTDMLTEAVYDLGGEPYLIPKDDTDSPVGRTLKATICVSLVLVPFLLERAEDIRKLRPAWITEIYHEALAFAKERSEGWMPDEHEREGFVHYDSRYTPAA